MIFEDLPTTPTAEELLDRAFSRAARAGKAQGGLEGQQSMLQTAGNILADNLDNVVRSWPDLEAADPFYREIADAIVDVDELRQSLSRVGWAAGTIRDLQSEYQPRLRATDVETARKHRKQAFARLADVVESVDDDLRQVNEARNALRTLPDIDPEEPTIVVAGYPNVGKSSFVNAVTRARGETASYPFTTTGIGVGHCSRDHVRYQVVDTPGLLDRHPSERNEIESQAVSALTHLADCVLVLLDSSETCGYPLSDQLELRDAIEERFDVPVLTVGSKADRSRAVEADQFMSTETGEGVEEVLDATIEAVGYEPELPFE